MTLGDVCGMTYANGQLTKMGKMQSAGRRLCGKRERPWQSGG